MKDNISDGRISRMIEMYAKGNPSTVIGEEFGMWPADVRRALKNAGVLLRTPSQAAKLAIKTGRRKHWSKSVKPPQHVKPLVKRRKSKGGAKTVAKQDFNTTAKRIYLALSVADIAKKLKEISDELGKL